jgi:dihydrofolate reductase
VKVSIVVAVAENNSIGKNNQLLWHLPDDLKHFKNITTGGTIIMGRKTFESIGKPLPNRISIVISTQKNFDGKGAIVVSSLDVALEKCKNKEEVFIIGGGEIYKYSLPFVDCIYLTKVHQNFEGDTFFPDLEPADWKVISEVHHQPDEKNEFPYSFFKLERIN